MLQRRFKQVWIDTERGIDVKRTGCSESDSKRAAKTDKAPTAELPSDTEINKARQLHKKAQSIVSTLMDDIRLGHSLELEQARVVVDETVHSIMRNQNALLYLSQLKRADTDLAQRSVNTMILALAFGKCITMSKKDLPQLGLGALLYDLGMTAVPDSIRNKSGALSDEEYDIVKSHVEGGVEILQKNEGITDKVMDVILTHHERFDGSGYPQGLQGKEIGLMGRIVAIVSAYSAMTSRRSYAPSHSMKGALANLYEECDRAYDGTLVKKLIQCIGVYPPGCVVELNSGEVGLVVVVNPQDRLRPMLRICLDASKRPLDSPYLLDMSSADAKESSISRALDHYEYDLTSSQDKAIEKIQLSSNTMEGKQ